MKEIDLHRAIKAVCLYIAMLGIAGCEAQNVPEHEIPGVYILDYHETQDSLFIFRGGKFRQIYWSRDSIYVENWGTWSYEIPSTGESRIYLHDLATPQGYLYWVDEDRGVPTGWYAPVFRLWNSPVIITLVDDLGIEFVKTAELSP